jgi:hypothetical protein
MRTEGQSLSISMNEVKQQLDSGSNSKLINIRIKNFYKEAVRQYEVYGHNPDTNSNLMLAKSLMVRKGFDVEQITPY